MIPAFILCAIFLMLSAVHLYWLFASDPGFDGVVPSKNGEPLFRPGKASTLAVAIALLVAALLCLWRGLDTEIGPEWIRGLGLWGVAVVFALRGFGDFRYVGIFKRVRGTKFAQNDSLIFSPLCLVISGLAVWLAL